MSTQVPSANSQDKWKPSSVSGMRVDEAVALALAFALVLSGSS